MCNGIYRQWVDVKKKNKKKTVLEDWENSAFVSVISIWKMEVDDTYIFKYRYLLSIQ